MQTKPPENDTWTCQKHKIQHIPWKENCPKCTYNSMEKTITIDKNGFHCSCEKYPWMIGGCNICNPVLIEKGELNERYKTLLIENKKLKNEIEALKNGYTNPI